MADTSLSARINALAKRLSDASMPSDVSAAIEAVARQVSAASVSQKQKNKVLTQLYWAGKSGKYPDTFPQEVLTALEDDGLIKMTRHATSRYRLTEKGVEKFASISKKKKELVEKGVRRHASVDEDPAQQATRALNRANQAIFATGAVSSQKHKTTWVGIPLPKKYASRFPDAAVHNHGDEPHITMLFVGDKDYSPGEQSEILYRVRAAAKTIPPFRVYVDPNTGLRDFGEGEAGEKALWLPARSEPRGELERLHRMLRLSLEREGVVVAHQDSFVPHVTWAYVSNEIPEDKRRRLDAHVADRFRDGFYFEVRSISLSMPDGSTKNIALSPLPKKTIY